ncbi:acyl-CoA dehydrogenase family protein [Brevibacillus centrosporus]|uniref:Acyl-CoA dehydrogenase n=1 Tax=Brevibacillus centrosporus TaxID=54910 RepID=A0A1I4E5Z5_9BACL|nr:acyl-CoA dehydrogenase family protein [Brevibacillus centrosporus]SFK99786.1 Acyl-CoA dehydrogenase [Brevibacillus centrosporus]
MRVETLIEQGIHLTTLPDQDGKIISPLEYCQLISQLAEESPSIALSISMHLYTIWGLQYLMNEEQKQKYFEKVKKENLLFSSLNEPGLYFVTEQRFNKEEYPIVADKSSNGFIVNGIKKYVSLEPYVRYLPLYCLVQGYQGPGLGIALIIVDKQAPGVTVHSDWTTISMKDTYSNTISLDGVKVEPDQVICNPGEALEKTELLGYLFRLSISSVYYGIAKKAVDIVTENSKNKKVPHTNSKLGSFPGVQFSLSEMLILQETAYSQIRFLCELLNEYLNVGASFSNNTRLNASSLITKEYVTKSAEEIVNKAMKIAGVGSLYEENILSGLYQDVKAGRFHPPQTDVILEILAKQRLGIISLRSRWL